MPRPHIHVILAADDIPPSLSQALTRTEATASFWPLAEALRAPRTPIADAVVVVVPTSLGETEGPLRVLLDRLAEHPRATLILNAAGQPIAPIRHAPTLPVTFFSGSDGHELAGRLTTMLEMRESLESLYLGVQATRRSGENLAKRYVSQLRLASQVQREFLPASLPRYGPVSFQAVFRPVDYVSGDFYDVHRLDEEHVGIAVADATGHGIPAALLTVYVKRALRGKEIENGGYRILQPDEVLARLNEDLLDAQLSECPFVAAVYAVLNVQTLELTLARGGAPYPIHRHADGTTEMLMAGGGVVGALPDVRFEVQTLHLTPGDCLLLYSDGLERVVAPESSAYDGPAGLRDAVRGLDAVGADGNGMAAEAGGAAVATVVKRTSKVRRGPPPGHDVVYDSAWYTTLQDEGPAAALAQVTQRQQTLRRIGYPLDDLTLLSVQVDEFS